MVTKTGRKTRKSTKTQSMHRFRITLVRNFIFRNAESLRAYKANVAKHVKGAKFSAATKTRTGLKVAVTTSYLKKLPSNMSVSVIASYIRAQAQGAKVSVKRV